MANALIFKKGLLVTKKIEAIVREEKLYDVKEALRRIGIVGLNVIEVRGHGRKGGIVLSGRTGTTQIDMLPRVQFNIVLSDHNVERTIQTIQEAAHTGESGDGLIFVYPVEDVIRISTGERGHEALMYEGDIDTVPHDNGVRMSGNGVKSPTKA
jgi:nitrogen regulatory protein P-II 1